MRRDDDIISLVEQKLRKKTANSAVIAMLNVFALQTFALMLYRQSHSLLIFRWRCLCTNSIFLNLLRCEKTGERV